MLSCSRTGATTQRCTTRENTQRVNNHCLVEAEPCITCLKNSNAISSGRPMVYSPASRMSLMHGMKVLVLCSSPAMAAPMSGQTITLVFQGIENMGVSLGCRLLRYAHGHHFIHYRFFLWILFEIKKNCPLPSSADVITVISTSPWYMVSLRE